MEYIDILGFVIAGLIGGFLSGMLGVGGGLIFVPVIQQILLNHQIKEDVVAYTLANSLALVFIIGITGTIKQLKLNNTHLFSALITGLSAIVTSFSITFAMSWYKWNDLGVFNTIFAVILMVTVVRMLFSKKVKELASAPVSVPRAINFIPAGLFAGVITAISGLGGGMVMVPYFNGVLKLPMKFSTGLSLSVIPIIALPLLIFYGLKEPLQFISFKFQTGLLIWPVIIPIAAVAVISSQFGISYSQKLNPLTIKVIFIVFVCLTLVKMFLFS